MPKRHRGRAQSVRAAPAAPSMVGPPVCRHSQRTPPPSVNLGAMCWAGGRPASGLGRARAEWVEREREVGARRGSGRGWGAGEAAAAACSPPTQRPPSTGLGRDQWGSRSERVSSGRARRRGRRAVEESGRGEEIAASEWQPRGGAAGPEGAGANTTRPQAVAGRAAQRPAPSVQRRETTTSGACARELAAASQFPLL